MAPIVGVFTEHFCESLGVMGLLRLAAFHFLSIGRVVTAYGADPKNKRGCCRTMPGDQMGVPIVANDQKREENASLFFYPS